METTETTKTEGWADAAAASATADQAAEKLGGAVLSLPCKLTDEELIAKGNALAEKLAEIDDVEERAKAAASRAREQRKELDEEASKLAAVVRAKAEERKVACTIYKILALGIARTVRDDTGEIVSDRALSYSERQGSLFADVAADSDDPDDEGAEDEGDDEGEGNDSDVDAESGRGDLEDQLDQALAEGDAIDDPQAVLDGVSDDPDAKPAKKKRGKR